MKRRNVIIAAIALVAIIAAILVIRDWVIPTFSTASVTGVPTAVNPFAATKTNFSVPASKANNNGLQRVAFAAPVVSAKAQQPLYRSCTDDRGTTPTPTGLPATIVPDATTAATPEATTPSTPTASDLFVVRVVGAESEACYQVGEVFFDSNDEFNLAVGVTKTIDGFVQIDRANVANSQIGEIVINIAEFQSDNPRRDGIIRDRWLESNKYPLAKFIGATFVGLPARPYQDGEVLAFDITGNLEVHATTKQVTFHMQGSLTGDTLVVTGYADVKMSDFGFSAPEIGGMLKANDEARLILNLVARPEKAA
ncbi:MAG: YceI family protein [Anaerolineae bacterium]|nr:YceI family protein [Anaerolineae bacterium]